jgi:signal transduction histidine kinase
MSNGATCVLLVEDNPGDARLIREMLLSGETLMGERFTLTTVQTLADGLAELANGLFDIVLLDLNLPDSFGVETLLKVRMAYPFLAVVVLTGFDDQSRGVQYVQEGAQDYLVKGISDGNLLSRSIRYAIERKKIETAEHQQRMLAEALRDTASVLTSTLNLDEVLDRILSNIGRVVPHDTANIMLVSGETVQIVRRYGYAPLEINSNDWKPHFSLHEVPTFVQMVDSPQPVVIPDLHADDNLYALTRLPRVRAYAGVPIRLQNEVIGFINLFSYTANFFTDSHADRLEAFAEQAAIAIQNAQLYQQSQQLAAVEERQRLARELHDSVTQTLFTSTVIAESALRQWDKDLEKTQSLVTQVHSLTTSALAEMRVLLLELRPASLAQVNLKHLIKQLGQSIRGRRNVELTVEIDEIQEPNADVKIALYRIAQEALNNVVKHSLATRVKINVKDVGGGIELMVEDNGRGFDLSGVAPASLGLNIMRERADDIEAQLEVESVPGEYTRIRALWLEQPIEEQIT